MTNLKKILSASLALTMTAGLFATTAFAKDADSYTDAGQIVNKEAVSVLSGLGVIAGKEDGSSFDPTANVTRAEMAKMITWAVLGDVDVSAFTGTEVPLTDLGLAAWAEGYMKYCYSQGYISGRGDGRFDPNANVTTAEAARMLLGAIGYHSEVQGYTGTSWKINTIRDAQQSKFFDNLSVAADKALTRDEAAQLIYNAVQARTIEKTATVDRVDGNISDRYDATGPSLLSKTFGAKIFVGTFEGNNNFNSAITKGSIRINGRLDSEPETNPNTSKSNDRDATFPSDLDISNIGEQYKVIFQDGKTGSIDNTPDKNDTIYGIYKTGKTQVVNAAKGDVKNLDASTSGNKNKIKVGDSTYEVVEDAVNVFTNYINSAATPATSAASNPSGSDAEDKNSALTNALKASNGDTIKLVLNEDGKVENVYVTEYNIAKVSNVTSTRVTLQGVGSFNIADNNVYSGVAANDVVVYTRLYSSNSIDDSYFTVTKAQTVEGTLTGLKNQENVVVGGTTYSIMNAGDLNDALADSAVKAVTSTNISDTLRLYLVNGYVGGMETISSTGGNYAIITSKDSGTEVGTGLNAKRANVLLSDGTTRTVYIHKDSTADTAGDTKISTDVSTYITEGNLIEYGSISSDNVIRIKQVVSSDSDSSKELWNKTTKEFADQGVPATNATLFVKVTSNDNYYVYALRDLGNITATAQDAKLKVITNSDGAVIAAYAELTSRPGSSSAVTRYGMIREYVQTINEDDTDYNVYTITVDGDKEVTAKIDGSVIPNGTLVKFDENTTNQQYAKSDIEVLDIIDVTTMEANDDYDKGSWYLAWGRDYSASTNLLRFYEDLNEDTISDKTVYSGKTSNGITTASDVKFVFVNANSFTAAGENLGTSVMGVDPDNGTKNLVFHVNSDKVVDVIIVETSGKTDLGEKNPAPTAD